LTYRSFGDGNYGQNIAAIGGSGNFKAQKPAVMAARAISDQWYNGEVNAFLPSYYGKPTPDLSNFDAWGHFSQVVWKASTKVGCASHYCPPKTIFEDFGSWFTVCNYRAAGQYFKFYLCTVLRFIDATQEMRPRFTTKTCCGQRDYQLYMVNDK
jgi:hypothetical protein